MTVPAPLDPALHLEAVATESARFVEVLAAVDAAAPVPTCPGWTAEDLLWHLTEVQLFWAAVCEGPVVDDSGIAAVEQAAPGRPQERGALLGLAGTATGRLLDALRAGTPSTPAWSWYAADRTMGFTMRRQAHEALVHRADAELTAGADVTLPGAALAADGVDELLRVMWGLPDGDWARWDPSGGLVRVETTDTGDAWSVRLGRWSGTGPESGTVFDEATALVVDDDGPPAALLRGRAADLDLWLWNRAPHAELDRDGDPDVHAQLEEVRAQGVR